MKIIILSIAFLTSATAFAGELANRTYKFKTYGNQFSCQQGIPPNGHNFPTSTVISFSTKYGSSGIYFPTKIPLNNTNEVWFVDQNAKDCESYSEIIGSSGELEGKAIQEYSTSIGKAGNGECFKTTREDLTIEVEGYSFSGSNKVYVPMEASDCP